MFSTATFQDGPSKGTRSSRRRQRPTSSDSLVQQPRSKRQRLPLNESTFVNPDVAPEMFEVKADKIDLLGVKRNGIENFGASRKELSLRSKKPKAGERISKGDGSIILTTNNAYTVSKLPALPDRIRADSQNKRQHGAVHSSNGYALTLTHTHALVWPYTSTAPSPETFVFALPYPSKYASDPLPLGYLVAPSASSDEPGLLVIMPVSGKIVYWESISSAATLEFIREQRTGVENSIPGMFSGEHVTQIASAEPVGFALAFSTGRLACLNVRDTHGRPNVSVQFLRNGSNSASGGFLGSIRNALSTSSFRGNIAAVRAGPGSKVGERAVVAITSKGKLHSWQLQRNGHHEALLELDIRTNLVTAVRDTEPDSVKFPEEGFEIFDFTFIPRGLENRYAEASALSDALSGSNVSFQHLLLLCCFSNKAQATYCLVELVIDQGKPAVGLIRSLRAYKSPVRPSAPARPRVYLPRPGLVAFVVFDRAVVVASMTAPPDSPDSQLVEASSQVTATFEDVIDFQDVEIVQVVGSGIEEPLRAGQEEVKGHRHRSKNPAAMLLVQGVGIVRIALTDIDRFASAQPPRVTAKGKLEQAVFFGIKDDNPLVFRGRRDLPFSNQEIANAAIELSNEIVMSKTTLISNVPASVEANMTTRLSYLDRIISHLNALGVTLDARARWMLLFNAEKMAVAKWVWRKNEQFVERRPKEDIRNMVAETIVCINEEQRTEPRPDLGQVDAVRHWFIHDVWRLEIFVAWAYQIIKLTYKERFTDEASLNHLVWEAVTIMNGAIREAHEYRSRNYQLYGLESAENRGGDAIPEPWTSNQYILNNLKRLVEFCDTWLSTYYPCSEASMDYDLLKDVCNLLPSLTGRWFTLLNEYITWADGSDDPRATAFAQTCRKAYADESVAKILVLKEHGLWDEAIKLATEFESFNALAALLVEQVRTFQEKAESREISASEALECSADAEAKLRDMGDFMDEYGKPFADQAFTQLLDTCGIRTVLDFSYGQNKFKTEFLRSKPELAKISWINDVQSEHDVAKAAETLLDLGAAREQQIWNKKIELSLGKLALLAQEEPDLDDDLGNRTVDHEASIEKVDRELSIIQIQDNLYNQILPVIETAVDASAELELALKEHASPGLKKQKALFRIFEDALDRLIKHEVLSPTTLIDLLTLVELHPVNSEAMGDQFYLALKVAEFSLKGQQQADMQRLIWRRCFIRDDWKAVNETNLKNDADQVEVINETALYGTCFALINDGNHEGLSLPALKPSDCAGVFTESLDARFDGLDDTQSKRILEAMRWEDARLHNFMEKCQLEAWQVSVLKEAGTTIREHLASLNTQATGHANGHHGHADIHVGKRDGSEQSADGDDSHGTKTHGGPL